MNAFGVFEYIEQFTQPVLIWPGITLHSDSFWNSNRTMVVNVMSLLLSIASDQYTLL